MKTRTAVQIQKRTKPTKPTKLTSRGTADGRFSNDGVQYSCGGCLQVAYKWLHTVGNRTSQGSIATTETPALPWWLVNVRFTHARISNPFRNGNTLDARIDKLASEDVGAGDFPPLIACAVEVWNQLVAYDFYLQDLATLCAG